MRIEEKIKRKLKKIKIKIVLKKIRFYDIIETWSRETGFQGKKKLETKREFLSLCSEAHFGVGATWNFRFRNVINSQRRGHSKIWKDGLSFRGKHSFNQRSNFILNVQSKPTSKIKRSIIGSHLRTGTDGDLFSRGTRKGINEGYHNFVNRCIYNLQHNVLQHNVIGCQCHVRKDRFFQGNQTTI